MMRFRWSPPLWWWLKRRQGSTPANALLDSTDAALLDSDGNYITEA